jgi:cytochrome c oxidase cbb3-type subunit 3
MIEVVSRGSRGTAMIGFEGVLPPDEIEAVVDFVRAEFMRDRRPNTRYHTAANGWPDHDRYRAAFPFATGEISAEVAWEELSPSERAGRQLLLDACVTCHPPGRVDDSQLPWEREAISYPRFGFEPAFILAPPDAWSGATSFAKHDLPPRIDGLSPKARQGEALYQSNCAFCHAADGTGRNWIGSFLQPHPRNLTSRSAMGDMSRERLERVIREGIPGTSMPAWGSVLSDREISAIADYVAAAFHPLSDVESGLGAPPSSRSASRSESQDHH